MLAARLAAGNEASIRNMIAASAEAYAFPTKLDRDPARRRTRTPDAGRADRQALSEGWSLAAFGKALAEHATDGRVRSDAHAPRRLDHSDQQMNSRASRLDRRVLRLRGRRQAPTGRNSQISENRGVRVFLLADLSGVVTGSMIDWDQTCSAATTKVTRTPLLSY